MNTVNRRSLFELLEGRDRVLFSGGHCHVTFQHFLGKEFGRVNQTPIHHIATTAACGPVLEKGVHKIVVWTMDMYGQEFTQTKIIEVE